MHITTHRLQTHSKGRLVTRVLVMGMSSTQGGHSSTSRSCRYTHTPQLGTGLPLLSQRPKHMQGNSKAPLTHMPHLLHLPSQACHMKSKPAFSRPSLSLWHTQHTWHDIPTCFPPRCHLFATPGRSLPWGGSPVMITLHLSTPL